MFTGTVANSQTDTCVLLSHDRPVLDQQPLKSDQPARHKMNACSLTAQMNKDCLTGSGTAAISHQQRAPPGWAVQMTHGTPSVASSHLSAWLQTTGTSPGVQLMTRHHQSCHHVTQ